MTADARLAAAASLRDLNNAFVAHDADEKLLERITAFAAEAAAELRMAERRDRVSMLADHVDRLFGMERPAAPGDSARPAAPDGEGPPEVSEHRFDPMTDRAVGGRTNPISADFEVEYDADEVVVHTVLGAAYEGAPGRAHGGMVAALFDDFTGYVLPLAGTAAYTGELTVRYRKPVPIGTSLEFRVRIVGRDGRKLHIGADCRAGEELVATAEALFVTVDIEQFGKPARQVMQ